MSDSDDENLRERCTQCDGRGTFAGHACHACGGKGFKMRIPGKPSRRRLDKPLRKRPDPK